MSSSVCEHNQHQQPRLPPELEQVIFEYAFLCDRQHPLNLLIVSKRVYDWIIPLVYEVLFVGFTPLQSLSRHGHHVRHLLLIHDDVSIVQILRYCKNVTNLGMWTVPYAYEWIAEAQTLSLTRMAGYMTLPLPNTSNSQTPLQLCTTPPTTTTTTTSQSSQIPGLQQTSSPCTWTSTITHLEMSITTNYWPDYEPLSQFTSLTHLALSNTTEIRLLKDLLNVCSKLEVIVWEYAKPLVMGIRILPGRHVNLHEGDGLVEGADDVRVVAVDRYATMDWMLGARGGMDAWTLAEEEVKRRKSLKSV